MGAVGGTGVEAVEDFAGGAGVEVVAGAVGGAGVEPVVGSAEVVEDVVAADGRPGVEIGEGVSGLGNRLNAGCDAGGHDAAVWPL